MKKTLNLIIVLLGVGMACVLTSNCKEKDVGDHVEEAADEIGDTVEETAEDIQDELEE